MPTAADSEPSCFHWLHVVLNRMIVTARIFLFTNLDSSGTICKWN